jgi:glycosyltransferase involved in cell wall biosynthesis
MENNFKIIIPAYNCEPWIKRCIWSVVNQNYLANEYVDRYKAVFIDDCSTDKTFDIVKNTFHNSGEHKLNFRFFQRTKNVGALENIVYGISTICFNDEDIIVLLDGDDALFSSDVLTYLNEVYQDPKICLTYN